MFWSPIFVVNKNAFLNFLLHFRPKPKSKHSIMRSFPIRNGQKLRLFIYKLLSFIKDGALVINVSAWLRTHNLRVWELEKNHNILILDGSDATHPDPDYSAVYVTLVTDSEDFKGYGITFTLGRGNEIVLHCVDSLRFLVINKDIKVHIFFLYLVVDPYDLKKISLAS